MDIVKKILIIDDKEENRSLLKDSLENYCTEYKFSYEVLAWDSGEIMSRRDECLNKTDSESNADEDIWSRILSSIDNLAVVAVDRDLSGLFAAGVSESAVITACLQESIPVCTYHRKPSMATVANRLSSIIRQSTSYSIKVDIHDTEYAAKKIVDIAKGFSMISDGVGKINLEDKEQSPARILAEILEVPGVTQFLNQYAHSTSLASFIIDGLQEECFNTNSPSYKERISYILGCWLHNHILAFPGLILNETATRSYINLDENSFEKHKALFDSSKYMGPFSGCEEYWWRFKLDDQIDEYRDAIEYLSELGALDKGENIAPCKCSEDPTLDAGYYCVITQKPISLEKSDGRLSWIPIGADLCRVNKKKYISIAPLMGL